MKRIFGATVMLGLVAWSAVSLEAGELNGPGDEAGDDIIVVNNYVTSVRVYVEDSEGALHQLGLVGRGKSRAVRDPRRHLKARRLPGQGPPARLGPVVQSRKHQDRHAQCRGQPCAYHVAHDRSDAVGGRSSGVSRAELPFAGIVGP